VVSIPINHLFPAGAKTVAGKIQAVILVVCDKGLVMEGSRAAGLKFKVK